MPGIGLHGVPFWYVVDVSTVAPALLVGPKAAVTERSTSAAAAGDIPCGDAGVQSVYVVDHSTVASEDAICTTASDEVLDDVRPMSASASAVARPLSIAKPSARMTPRRVGKPGEVAGERWRPPASSNR
jgi:hypothetical protein